MLFHFRLYEFGEIGIGIGWIGVQLFFVLSGFLITRILIQDKKYSLNIYLKKFYWRRALRIFPIYFAYLLILTFSFWLFNFPPDLDNKAVWLYTYTYNFTRLSAEWSHSIFFTHLWSLSVEEQFYLFWPFFIFFLRGAYLRVMLLFIIIGSPIIRWLLAEYLLTYTSLDHNSVGEAVYWFTLSHFDAFAMGAVLTIFKINEKVKLPGVACLYSLLVVLVLGIINLLIPHAELYEISSLGYPIASLEYGQHIWSYSVLNIFFALLILWIASPSSWAIFSSPFLVSIGKVSYGMYLFHWAVLGAINQIITPINLSSLLVFILYLLAVYLIAWISYNLFERHFLRLKDKVSPIKMS